MRNTITFLVFFLLISSFCLALPQLTPDQVAERAKWEEFLETAEIVGYDQPLNPRDAVTEPWKAQDLKPSSGAQVASLNRVTYLQRAFDNLIANSDRNEGDVLYTKDWRMILIDHSRAFSTSKKYTKKLLFDENSKPAPKPMKRLPRAFVEKLRSMNPGTIKEAVGEYLTNREIECVLIRRDLIIENLNKRIEKLGEEAVLY